jgi:putative hydrolase of the HAD superfamily
VKPDVPRYRFLLCDLDNTLYPPDAGVLNAVGRRIVRYIVDSLDVSPDEAEQLKAHYYRQYGTTMRGLILHHGIDPEDYLTFVHDVPLEEFIQPNPDLDSMLASIPLRKAVFTNADGEHARRVLDVLGVGRHFEWIVDVSDFGFNSKPHLSAYHRTLDILDTRADECIMADDSAENLAPAKSMGMLTVLVGIESPPESVSRDGADMHIPNILQLADAIGPWLES